MVGGASEYVMANMVDETGAFNPGYAGSSWNGSTTLDTFYYNAYSYGEEYNFQIAFNRAILGDATAEVVGSVDWSGSDAWQPGTGITGSCSNFIAGDFGGDIGTPWFVRGGHYFETDSGLFCFFSNNGGTSGSDSSFRQSIS